MNVFDVEIKRGKYVSALRDAIKDDEIPNQLWSIDANQLELYKVTIPIRGA